MSKNENIKTKWQCKECNKSLSSKRSYSEHLNVHNSLRPFACSDCGYAAASQMTLRRHKLRNHVHPQDWSYQCPYCAEPYMEPASYKQHILSKHNGGSATFGCPYIDCTFSTKAVKHFHKHINNHILSTNQRSNDDSKFSVDLNLRDPSSYLVGDENSQETYTLNGKKNSKIHRKLLKRVRKDGNPANKPNDVRGSSYSNKQKFTKTNGRTKLSRNIVFERIRYPTENCIWIEKEIIIKDAVFTLPDGQMDLELD